MFQARLLLLSLSNNLLLAGLLNDTNSNSLFHISDSESSKRWEFFVSFNAKWLVWNQFDQSSFTVLEGFWFFFNNLTSSLIDLGQQFVKSASNVSSVAINNWRVSLTDLILVVHNDNLSSESFDFSCWFVIHVRGNITLLESFSFNTSNVESNIVTWTSFWELFVMHL